MCARITVLAIEHTMDGMDGWNGWNVYSFSCSRSLHVSRFEPSWSPVSCPVSSLLNDVDSLFLKHPYLKKYHKVMLQMVVLRQFLLLENVHD
jgi:hypothetical protein